MSRLYTRKGDGGETVLFGGTRVRKDDPRVEAYGTVDELNAHLGLAASLTERHTTTSEATVLRDRLMRVQRELLAIGAELATPADKRDKPQATKARQVARLEAWIDEASRTVPPLKTFIVPGGDVLASQLQVCRTVCRRAERRVAALAGDRHRNPSLPAYLNRLSDLLFAWARLVNQRACITETHWNPKSKS